jgi:hypothetical protein
MTRAARRNFGRIQNATVIGDEKRVLHSFKPDAPPRRPKLGAEVASRGPAAGERAPPSPPPHARGGLATIMLDSGLTLADWVLLAEDRLKAKDYTKLLVEGGMHRRKHGAFVEVQSVIAQAAQGLLKGVRVADARAAREALPRLARIKAVAGATPRIVALEAQAYHATGNFAKAQIAYKAWLKAVPADYPDRKRMALGLTRAYAAARRDATGQELPGKSYRFIAGPGLPDTQDVECAFWPGYGI